MALSNQFSKSGSVLVEIIIAIALMAYIAPAIIDGLITTRQGEPQQNQRLTALALIKETQESLRVIREKGWSAFAVNGTFHPQISAGSWTLLSGTETVGDFSRSITISDVYRDTFGNIGSSGIVDSSTKKVLTTINWTEPIASSVTTLSYLTRYLDNLSYEETTASDFNAGIGVGVTVTSTNGGEIILGSGGRVDWCKPDLTINALDLPGQAYASDISAIEGRAFVTTGGNSSGDSMDRIDVTNSNPPVASNTGIYNNRKSYAIFATPAYNYLTSDHPSLTVDIVNSATLTHAGYFLASGGGKGNGVYVDGNIGYVTAGSKLYTFDTSTITGNNQSELASISLAGIGQKVVVKNGFAYVAISGSSIKLQIISSTNGGRSLKIIGQADFDSQSAVGVAVNSTGSRTYVITAASGTQKELFIINTADKPLDPPTPVNYSVVGSYEANGMNPKGIIVVFGNKVIIVGSGGEQYQVVDISSEATPSRCGGLTNPYGASTINAIATVVEQDSDSYSYILTNNSSKELQIIEGGPGGVVSINGNFTSKIFSLDRATAFNRFNIDAETPSSTEIRYQFALAPQVSGSCVAANYVFVGPDGTPSTFFTSNSGAMPLSNDGLDYENPGSCFRYKVYLSSADRSQTPVFNSISVNYSP
ncbi:MAG: hypothetical protein WC841_05695 [Candidatus Shapirobacteria bacterium]|jgi:hypothetical protein